MSAVSALDSRTEAVSSQGTATGTGITVIPSSLIGGAAAANVGAVHGPASRELQFFSCINQGTATNVVTLGKVVTLLAQPGGTTTSFFQFSPPIRLLPNESFTYVKEAGFAVYDSFGLPKQNVQSTSNNLLTATVALGTSQSIASGAVATVNFDTVLYDPSSMWAPGSHAFRAPVDGSYVVTGCLRWTAVATDAGGRRTSYFLVNGVATPQYGNAAVSSDGSGAAGFTLSTLSSAILSLAAGDLVTLVASPNTSDASPVSVVGSGSDGAITRTSFSMAKVG